MNIPLNIDWQQILLHWMNLAILAGGLYFLLYKPVKGFMDKRQAHYREQEEQAQEKLRQAAKAQADYQAKLDGVQEEIRQAKAQAEQDALQATQEQLAQAKAQAEQIVAKARMEAERSQEQARQESQRELKELAVEATRKLVFKPGDDPFDQFLDLQERSAERGGK